MQKINTLKIGDNIRNLRKKNNITQEKLAKDAGYSVRNLRRIENGGTNSIETICVFADVFNVDVMDILDGCFFILYFLK